MGTCTLLLMQYVECRSDTDGSDCVYAGGGGVGGTVEAVCERAQRELLSSGMTTGNGNKRSINRFSRQTDPTNSI